MAQALWLSRQPGPWDLAARTEDPVYRSVVSFGSLQRTELPLWAPIPH